MSDTPKRGTKRKRYEPPQKDPQVKLTGKLHHVSKEVRKAAKKAKTFETQKLVKKLKAARSSNDGDVALLESQLESLKHTSPDHLASLALLSKIRKDRILSGAIPEQDILALFSSPPSTSDSKYIESRLLSSKTLAEQVGRAIGDLRAVIAPSKPKEDEAEERELSKPLKRAKPIPPTQVSSISSGNESEGEDDDNGLISDTFHSEVDDAGWESGTVDEEQSEAEDEQPSTFLPSLAVGYIQGSEESPSDDEAQVADGARKNRRGQRARRAIWEKKYGRHANHMKNERDAQKKRERPIVARHTVKTPVRHKRPSQQELDNRPKDSGWDRTNVTQTLKKPNDQLHPSWAAKKKEKEKSSAGIVPFQGKKIIF